MARRPFFKAASSLAAILILAAGCGDQTPTAVHLQETGPAASGSQATGPKVNVVKTRYAAGTYAAVIGPQGGRIDFGIGSLDFPAGALSRTTRITATTDGENLGVTFGPHGLQFPEGRQPMLGLSYMDVATDPEGLQIVYVNNMGEILEELTTSADISTSTVGATLRHFSTYWMAAP
jgi:hypothetical protein